jgi:hypothetical protein
MVSTRVAEVVKVEHTVLYRRVLLEAPLFRLPDVVPLDWPDAWSSSLLASESSSELSSLSSLKSGDTIPYDVIALLAPILSAPLSAPHVLVHYPMAAMWGQRRSQRGSQERRPGRTSLSRHCNAPLLVSTLQGNCRRSNAFGQHQVQLPSRVDINI